MLEKNTPLRIGIVAGETSGDLLAASLIESFKKLYPNASFEGIAGPSMVNQGCRALFEMKQISYMGLFEILKHIPELLAIRKKTIEYFLQNPPDVFIGIDAPDFNLPLEKIFKKNGITTVHYVSPTVWAWRQYRVKNIKKTVDLLLTLFPYEAKFFEKHQIPVRYVGHPFADEMPTQLIKEECRQQMNLPLDRYIVTVLAGSRSNELQYLAEIFVKAMDIVHNRFPNILFVMPMVNEERMHQMQDILKILHYHAPIQLQMHQAQGAIAASDVILAKAGTVSLEAMLLKKPMVIAYRMSTPTYWLAKCLIKTPFIALPNLLAEEKLVPEFIQHEVTAENLAKEIIFYLEHPEKIEDLTTKFDELHALLKQNASMQAAIAIAELIGKKKNEQQ